MKKKIGTVMVKDADMLINLIVKQGDTPSSFSQKVSCSKSQMCLIVKGERNPSPNLAMRICKVLGKEFEELFFIVNDDKSNQKNRGLTQKEERRLK